MNFPVFVPRPFLDRIERGNPDDPLLRQILPLAAEEDSPPEFTTDPLAESEATLTPGLLQKYTGRALLVTNGTCAVHCRYCFRRHFPYAQTPRSVDQWQPAFERIASDTSLEEVILSGGDPLTIVDPVLGQLVERLAAIPHVRRLRIHTRLPIMIPQRTTGALTAMLRQFARHGRQAIVVIHANHPQELDESVRQSLDRLRESGCLLLNQSVLLAGVNDRLETLVALSRRLMDCGTVPYYLHQLDPVIGTAHFAVDRSRGESLIDGMRSQLPGYAVPRYVKEIAGKTEKTIWR